MEEHLCLTCPAVTQNPLTFHYIYNKYKYILLICLCILHIMYTYNILTYNKYTNKYIFPLKRGAPGGSVS